VRGTLKSIAIGLTAGFVAIGAVEMLELAVEVAAEEFAAFKSELAAEVATPSSPAPDSPPVDVRKVIRLWGHSVIGHGCPVSSSEALTAAHVAGVSVESFFGREHHGEPLVWSDGFGGGGVATEVSYSRARDVARVKAVTGKFAYWFEVSARPPAVGETVYLAGYDYDGAFRQKLVEARVLDVFGSHVTYDKSGLGGSSGSCVFLADGTVVGVNVAQVKADQLIGIGVLVTGEWGL
jgi:hypothetical protein